MVSFLFKIIKILKLQLHFTNPKRHLTSYLQMVFSIFRKIILPTILLFLCFFIVSNQLKAQIPGLFDENDAIGISSLMKAAISDDVPAVSFFIKSNPATINQQNIGGASPLHIASRKGNLEICKILIENGADVNVVDNEGWTPLMRAITSKNSDLVKMLLDKGADAKKLNSVGESSIIISASSECGECLKQILPIYNSDNNFYTTALKNQLDNAMIIARNRNDIAIQAILTGYINAKIKNIPPVIESLNNEKGSQVSNRKIITEQLPELVQNKNSNKIGKETDRVTFKFNTNKKIFIFKKSKNQSSQYPHFNNQSSTNQTTTSPDNSYGQSKHQYKFLGKIKTVQSIDQEPVTKQQQIMQSPKGDKIDKKITSEALESNIINNHKDDNEAFIFKGSKNSHYTLNNQSLTNQKKEFKTNLVPPSNSNLNNLIKHQYKFLGKTKLSNQ